MQLRQSVEVLLRGHKITYKNSLTSHVYYMYVFYEIFKEAVIHLNRGNMLGVLSIKLL